MNEVDQRDVEELAGALTDEALAYEAKEVQHFLKHAALERAFKSTEMRVYRQWRIAGDPLSRERCWHKLDMFKELLAELRAFGDRGPTLTVAK